MRGQTKHPKKKGSGPRKEARRKTISRLRHTITRDARRALALVAVVVAINLAVKHTEFGRQLEQTSYNLLQLRLRSADNLPVTVVDITDLKPQGYESRGRLVTFTPRDSLRQMIEAIAEQQPKAIGVDIDFSPDEYGFIYPRDPEFFRFCLQLQRRTGVRVFLGIKRTLGLPPAEWLGSEENQSLAAHIYIPNEVGRMASVIHAPGSASKAMAVALAEAFAAKDPKDEFRPLVLFERWKMIARASDTTLGPGVSVQRLLIDFSPLESLERLRLQTTNPLALGDPSQRNRFLGKLVILGDATLGKATDPFSVPGRQRLYPGVYLHAASAYTLIRAPLFEVTDRGRLAIDLLFSLPVLMCVLAIRWHYASFGEVAATHRLQALLTILAVILPILAAVWFVRLTRVMWDDFLLTIALLVFHPSIERWLTALSTRAGTLTLQTWRRLVVEKPVRRRE